MSDEVKKNHYPDIHSLDRQVTSVRRTVKPAHEMREPFSTTAVLTLKQQTQTR
jgi:hypothetical protein